MAKKLNFKIGEASSSLDAIKLDRKKLYGWKEKLILDNKGENCDSITLFSDMSLLIPKGGVTLGSLTTDGKWVDKSELIHVDINGNPVEKVPSSFGADIELTELVPVEELLEHNITAVYSLQGEEESNDFINEVKKANGIYKFIFNYRADYEGDPAFLIEANGELFVLVGKKIEFEFIGLAETGVIESEEEEIEEEVDDFDFAMF
jgi:hypothetical protein